MKKFLLVGLVVILGTNILVIAGVYYNRTGEPSASLLLSERELGMHQFGRRHKENSAKSLFIKWNMPNTVEGFNRSRLLNISRQQMIEFGFSLTDTKLGYSAPAKQFVFALEFHGEMFQQTANLAEVKFETLKQEYGTTDSKQDKNRLNRAAERFENIKEVDSRLYFKDIALKYDTLAQKYAGESNILLVKGLAKPFKRGKTEGYQLRLQKLLVQNIMLPAKFARQLPDDPTDQQYMVKVNWGKRLEPWVESMTVEN